MGDHVRNVSWFDSASWVIPAHPVDPPMSTTLMSAPDAAAASSGTDQSETSADHLRLKTEVQTETNNIPGWNSEFEVRADDGAWTADVMAHSAELQLDIAFETQRHRCDAVPPAM